MTKISFLSILTTVNFYILTHESLVVICCPYLFNYVFNETFSREVTDEIPPTMESGWKHVAIRCVFVVAACCRLQLHNKIYKVRFQLHLCVTAARKRGTKGTARRPSSVRFTYVYCNWYTTCYE